jgi:hypothetical protein
MGVATYKKSIIVSLVFLLFSSSLNAVVYKTYAQWEVDALLVAWLISRYVEKNSKFEVVEKGTYIEKRYAINTPNSKFRRSGKETAFESALRQLNIHNSCTNILTPIIRIIELAPWRKSEHIHVLAFESDVMVQLQQQDISAAFNYIDNYCRKNEK